MRCCRPLAPQRKPAAATTSVTDQLQGLPALGSSPVQLPFLNKNQPAEVQSEAGVRPETQQAVAQIPGSHWIGRLSGNQNRETAILIPSGVDLSRPVEVVYYLHGHHGTVAKSLADRQTGFGAEITAQAQAGRNRVWVIPQGPAKEQDYTWFNPKYQGSIQRFQEHAEAQLQTLAPGLKIGRVIVMGHSAGGRAILNASYGSWASATWANQRRRNPALEMNVIYIPGTPTAKDALQLQGQPGVQLIRSGVGHHSVPKAFISR